MYHTKLIVFRLIQKPSICTYIPSKSKGTQLKCCFLKRIPNILTILHISHSQPTRVWSLGAHWLIAARAYPSFCSMKQLDVFLLPLDGMLVHRRSLHRNLLGFPQQFTGSHLCTWVERGAVRVKCLAQEHNTMSPARALTRIAHSRVEHTNHEATMPPTLPTNKGTPNARLYNRKYFTSTLHNEEAASSQHFSSQKHTELKTLQQLTLQPKQLNQIPYRWQCPRPPKWNLASQCCPISVLRHLNSNCCSTNFISYSRWAEQLVTVKAEMALAWLLHLESRCYPLCAKEYWQSNSLNSDVPSCTRGNKTLWNSNASPCALSKMACFNPLQIRNKTLLGIGKQWNATCIH